MAPRVGEMDPQRFGVAPRPGVMDSQALVSLMELRWCTPPLCRDELPYFGVAPRVGVVDYETLARPIELG